MPRWSRRQDEWLREHAHLGAERCTELLNERFGGCRSVGAVRMHASRIGVYFARYEVCPECGAHVERLHADGICAACNYRRLAARARDEADRVRAEIESGKRDELAARREYDRARDRLRTARRKARDGDSV